ncbi:hypothetical protein K435DRAFT_805069 [Dendrothele bispora CBS 962.96]|uniref:Uncharacterized protein n=1 Tax=Dendrothele bispora (strain CBS 962.96) TaxID=1314807 RepID=A0A4S8LCB1_DENBC|nr:hypothetical protein K435DRAFT_805069 [Dendrothele bispora CBS 962.96]
MTNEAWGNSQHLPKGPQGLPRDIPAPDVAVDLPPLRSAGEPTEPDPSSSPLSTPPSSNPPSPHLSPALGSSTPSLFSATSTAQPVAVGPSPGVKKSMHRSKVSRQKKRMREKAKGPTSRKPRFPANHNALNNAVPIPTSLDTDCMAEATSGYFCKPTKVKNDAERKKWKLEELVGPGS